MELNFKSIRQYESRVVIKTEPFDPLELEKYLSENLPPSLKEMVEVVGNQVIYFKDPLALIHFIEHHPDARYKSSYESADDVLILMNQKRQFRCGVRSLGMVAYIFEDVPEPTVASGVHRVISTRYVDLKYTV